MNEERRSGQDGGECVRKVQAKDDTGFDPSGRRFGGEVQRSWQENWGGTRAEAKELQCLHPLNGARRRSLTKRRRNGRPLGGSAKRVVDYRRVGGEQSS